MPTTQVTPTEDALLQGIADALLKARKVVVITGAGISTNSGIPDFRSENGLYSLIQAHAASSETDETPPSSQPGKPSLPNIKGRDLFDASIWADPLRTSVFYRFATNLRQKVRDVQPTESHHFIGHLRNRGKLVRCYTQNIDQIEEKVGLSTSLQEGPGHRGRFSRKSMVATLAPTSSQGSEKGSCGNVESPEKETRDTERKPSGVECVFLHGSLESLRCFLCGKICAWDEGGRAQETLFGRQPECPFCAGATAARQERGKRALGVGKLRPDIVLYGEEHPNAHLISPIVTHDLGLQPDLLLILGTSLKVHGLKVLVREFARTIHGRGGKVVFVNFTKPPESSWRDIIDYWVQWDCDAWVSDLKARVPLLWQPPGIKPPKKKKEPSEKQKKRQSLAVERPKPTPAGLPEGVEISAPASSAVVSENLDQVDQLGTSGETATSPEETGSRFASDKGVPASTPALCVPQVVVPETLGIADEPAVAAELPISVELVVPEDTGRVTMRPLADISPNSRPRFQHDAMPSTASCYQQRSTPYSPPESQQSFTPHSAPFVQQNFALKPLSHFQHNSTADAQSHVEQHATLNRPPYLEQNSSPSLPVHVQQNFAPHPLSHFQHNSIRVEQHATPTQPSYLGQNFTLSSPTEAQHNFAPTLLCHFQQNPTPDYRPIVEQRDGALRHAKGDGARHVR
ncbi:NAD-dependent histone deacetylase HST3 [Colletotrichum orbiculare MAFF 240422]|uniref:NAD-dependent histone deacetylase HST3 n=1 Tax=Colletotrichum orbiculare (strain 104-T / ATCC 96160 / CBS 514.97 / LARS 414 / MAFF 240422) TaxID=1213857 RepID=A0A484FQF6_COLOR|nr:NAD-dependent histone deacetylase HST3 [Colletotrichum orbiculare MAFF 240422]